jgi:hypothetical protein
MENQKQNILIIESLNLLSEKKINEHLNNNNYEYIIINIFSKTSLTHSKRCLIGRPRPIRRAKNIRTLHSLSGNRHPPAEA